MPLQLLQDDLTRQQADALVTAANARLAGGGGVDGAIHRAAGPDLLRTLRTIGGCPTGSAVITPAFDLEKNGVKFIIHAVGPIWHGGGAGEPEQLAGAYRHSLELATERGCHSVAFPSISTGVYGYPVELAAPLAVSTVLDFLQQAPELDVRLVLFDRDTLGAYERALARLQGAAR